MTTTPTTSEQASVPVETVSLGEMDLVFVTVGNLGFPHGASLKEIYDKSRKFGWALCTPGAVPQILKLLPLLLKEDSNLAKLKGERVFIGAELDQDSLSYLNDSGEPDSYEVDEITCFTFLDYFVFVKFN